MPTYRSGKQRARRKNAYIPCAMQEQMDRASEAGDHEEFVRLLKEADWCDSVAASEWPVVLREDGCSPSARSRLKRKAAGWLLALWHVAELHPELFEEIVAKAETIRVEQHRSEPPVLLVWDGSLFVSGQPQLVGHPVNWHPQHDNEET